MEKTGEVENFNEKKLTSLLNGLLQEERAWLLRELLADYWQQSAEFSQQDILLAERWFINRIASAKQPGQREARQKYWAIFIFLRYGGLRPVEIFNLSREDIDLEQGIINIGGDFPRKTPLPLPICSRLIRIAQNSRLLEGIKPFYCDASQLRRVFRKCAREANLKRKNLTVNALRKLRAAELEKSGIHPKLVTYFFNGKTVRPGFKNPDAILLKQIQKEVKMDKLLKTSARNVFRGKVTRINKRGLLVDVTLETADGLQITSIITETSCKSLKLEKGKAVNALVKAPWVRVVAQGQPKANGDEINYYSGMVEEARSDENATEILVTIGDGIQLCSVIPQPATLAADIKKGAKVEVEINALAVILIEG